MIPRTTPLDQLRLKKGSGAAGKLSKSRHIGAAATPELLKQCMHHDRLNKSRTLNGVIRYKFRHPVVNTSLRHTAISRPHKTLQTTLTELLTLSHSKSSSSLPFVEALLPSPRLHLSAATPRMSGTIPTKSSKASTAIDDMKITNYNELVDLNVEENLEDQVDPLNLKNKLTSDVWKEMSRLTDPDGIAGIRPHGILLSSKYLLQSALKALLGSREPSVELRALIPPVIPRTPPVGQLQLDKAQWTKSGTLNGVIGYKFRHPVVNTSLKHTLLLLLLLVLCDFFLFVGVASSSLADCVLGWLEKERTETVEAAAFSVAALESLDQRSFVRNI
ncbi:hypothetical protein M9H77_08956 [Catharanthus roseus]|uniref:Uncharacterized protein n=1 Tax=Catharanthus roseus TaxID=4058 RepID=A0ACC0BZE9_CATRO|nr:hypothetical protein M9H77_08956 [Catharanthus roseus]